MTDHITAAEYQNMQRKPKRSKYGAKKTEFDGIKFDSKGEAERYAALKAEEKIGEIFDLKLQVKFPLEVSGHHVCNYTADFTYMRKGMGVIVEDFKGFRTPEYRLKAKLFNAVYGFPIHETGRGRSVPHKGAVR